MIFRDKGEALLAELRIHALNCLQSMVDEQADNTRGVSYEDYVMKMAQHMDLPEVFLRYAINDVWQTCYGPLP